MKYSILFPYCRRESLKSTLISFLHHYSDRKDYEVVIIEDIASNEDAPHHEQLLKIIDEFKDRINIVYCLDDLRSYNSARKYNIGFKNSTGNFIILSNPETFHPVNILKGLDEEFKKDPKNYVICSCRAVKFENQIIEKYEDHEKCSFDIWYQHSIYNNRMLHFFSAITRSNYIKTGGFDERYCSGIAYEDDCFLHRVMLNSIPIILRDDLSVYHIEHSRQYLHENQPLYRKNGELFQRQMATHDFFEKFI